MLGEVKSGGGITQWTTAQSAFVQNYLANLVAKGSKTSIGFKKVHINACVKALNNHFKINNTCDQIANHLKTMKKYTRINYLMNLSAALWDEDQFIITFDHEHYTNHFEVRCVAAFFFYLFLLLLFYMY
jgi:cupin superfamily acireductone dioxygenase involved in methionine salvage